MNPLPVRLRCIHGHTIPFSWDKAVMLPSECPECETAAVFIDPDLSSAHGAFFSRPRAFWEYVDFLLPPAVTRSRVSLGEGGTPLVSARSHEDKVHFKDESANPTRSYRDRAAALIVAHAKTLQFKTLHAASNGNLGAALSAYAANAGLAARIYSMRNMDIGKKSQVLAYGGTLLDHFIDYDSAVETCIEDIERDNGYQATAELNPLTIVAQQTMAYEIHASGTIPDEVYVPIGNGGTLFSLWKGFHDLREMGLIDQVPRMVGASVSRQEHTRISELKESSDFSQHAMVNHAIQASGGEIVTVSDDEISTTISFLARTEGYFVEPASASAYAALLLKEKRSSDTTTTATKVVILTATGLKAPIVIDALARKDAAPVEKVFHAKMNLRLHILEQLMQAGEQGLHGYGIYSTIKKDITCTKQSIYLHLKQLQEKHFIDSARPDDQGRKNYVITREGMEVLDLLKKLVSLL